MYNVIVKYSDGSYAVSEWTIERMALTYADMLTNLNPGLEVNVIKSEEVAA